MVAWSNRPLPCQPEAVLQNRRIRFSSNQQQIMQQTYEVTWPVRARPSVDVERRKAPGKSRQPFENLSRRFESTIKPELLECTLTWSRNRIRRNPRHRKTTRQVGRDVFPLNVLRGGSPLFLLFDLRHFRLFSLPLDLDLVIRFGTYRGRIRIANF